MAPITQARIRAVNAYVEAHRHAPLVWGVHDCCCFAADYLIEVHGRADAMATFRGRYFSRTDAVRLIQEGGGLEALISTALGPMQRAAALRVGDIAFGDFGDGPCVGISTGHNVAGVGPRGLEFIALAKVRGCWPV